MSSPVLRQREREQAAEFRRLSQEWGGPLAFRLNGDPPAKRTALLAGLGSVNGIGIELALLKGLELAGFEPVVVTRRDPWLEKYYRLAGVRTILYWDAMCPPISERHASRCLDGVQSLEAFLALEFSGTRVGRLSASTAIRELRVGSLEWDTPEVQRRLRRSLADGTSAALGAQRIIDTVRPAVALFVDRGYTPQGQLMDAALAAGVDCITWNTAHRSGTLMLKRYTRENRDVHPASLADESWRLLQSLDWTDARRDHLAQELREVYASGDWYSEAGTQFHKVLMDAEGVRRRFELDPKKKTAVIFPHILWDETFLMGRDLFRSYEECFVETVNAAARNNRVNWLIKVHPANVVKNVRDGYRGEPAELQSLRRQMRSLPPHIHLIPADSELNTYSLFNVMDYCLTVRGTIGVEAASFGIPVLTAGTGRYDRRGFTIDFETREAYLDRVAHIEELPALSAAQRELAQRFAYGVFILRPLMLRTVAIEFRRDAHATLRTRLAIRSGEEWHRATDLRAFAQWVSESQAADYLNPLDADPKAQDHPTDGIAMAELR